MPGMKNKIIFICSITENSLKVLRCLRAGYKAEVMAFHSEEFPVGSVDEQISNRLSLALSKLGFKNHPIIAALPCNSVTCRYLKVPSVSSEEIERILFLQAPRYLPYSAGELVSSYQVVSTDKEGYSCLNLVIAHKDLITRYRNIFGAHKPVSLEIILSSYGLRNIYAHIRPQDSGPIILLDVYPQYAELVIIADKRLIFSRCFKLDTNLLNWQNILIEEINKSRDAYSKDINKERPQRCAVFGNKEIAQECVRVLNAKTELAAEILVDDKINFSAGALIGLGLENIPAELNMLPEAQREKNRGIRQRKERLTLSFFIAGIILTWILGMVKTLDNQEKYLKQLKIELMKVAGEAKPLEEAEKRAKFIKERSQKKPTILEAIIELYQLIPDRVSLSRLDWQEDNELMLLGQAQELDAVFVFTKNLEKSAVFKAFNIKINHATKTKMPSGENVNFEISCKKR